eukprot:9560482-Ditylum_brightwellii.AAC.1
MDVGINKHMWDPIIRAQCARNWPDTMRRASCVMKIDPTRGLLRMCCGDFGLVYNVDVAGSE